MTSCFSLVPLQNLEKKLGLEAPGSLAMHLYAPEMWQRMPVTTRIIIVLAGDPYTPSFPLLLGGGTTQGKSMCTICHMSLWFLLLLILPPFPKKKIGAISLHAPPHHQPLVGTPGLQQKFENFIELSQILPVNTVNTSKHGDVICKFL